jgi:hypothetical protein
MTLDRPLLLESGRMMRGVIEEDRWKYIHDARHGTFELYDLQVDPTETNNLMTTEAARAERLGAFIDAFYETHNFRAPGYELPYFP